MGKVLPAGASGEASRKTDTDMRIGTGNFQNYYFGLDNVHLLISWTYDNVHFIGYLTFDLLILILSSPTCRASIH